MNGLVGRLAVAFSVFALAAGNAAADATASSPVAVLPLAAAPGYDQYDPIPTASQLTVLTSQLRSGLEARSLALSLLPQRHDVLSCATAECARSAGRNAGAHTVVFGAVQRAAGIFWSTRVSAIDVASGRVIDTETYGIMGDYESLLRSVAELGTCIGRSIAGKQRCKENSPAM